MSDQSSGDDKAGDAQPNAASAAKPIEPERIEPSPSDPLAASPVPNESQSDAEKNKPESNRKGSITEQEFVDRIRKSDRWMISLTAVAAFAAIGSAIIFGWQLHIMNRQLDAMQTQTRPWIEITSVFANPAFKGVVFIKDGSIGILPSVTVKNMGTAPSVGTELSARLIAYYAIDYTGWLEILNNSTLFCQFSRRKIESQNEWGNELVFPGETTTLITGAFWDLNIKKDYVDKHIVSSAGKRYIRLAVVGCVDYRIAHYSRVLQTSFAYTIRLRGSDSDLIPVGQNLTPQDLVFERFDFGNGYAD